MKCSAPAKLMIAGEYAVIEGGLAVLMAVDRRAIATLGNRPGRLSPFLAAAKDILAEDLGADAPAVERLSRVQVDTRAFRDGKKLGLGSSAAATVAAVGMALERGKEISASQVHSIARRAHRKAQSAQGAPGSGADVATSSFGGCIRFQPTGENVDIESLSLPEPLHWVFPWIGTPASTTSLVSQVQAFAAAKPEAYRDCCDSIAAAASSVACAEDTRGFLRALQEAGEATARLSELSQAPIWLPEHREMADIAHACGGACKSSGAGGGDLALAAFASAEGAKEFTAEISKREIRHHPLRVDIQGVRLHH